MIGGFYTLYLKKINLMRNFLPFLALLLSCNQQQTLKEKQDAITTGQIDKSYHYSCKEVGWETELPQNWNLFTKAESKALNDKGQSAIEKSTGLKVDASALKELVTLKKDNFNSFLSTIEPFDSTKDGDYAEHNVAVDKLIADTYAHQKIKMESKEGSEIVDGNTFHTWEAKIFAPGSDSNKVILWQKMYSRLINKYDFSMTLSYNNEADKAILMKIINSSKFAAISSPQK